MCCSRTHTIQSDPMSDPKSNQPFSRPQTPLNKEAQWQWGIYIDRVARRSSVAILLSFTSPWSPSLFDCCSDAADIFLPTCRALPPQRPAKVTKVTPWESTGHTHSLAFCGCNEGFRQAQPGAHGSSAMAQIASLGFTTRLCNEDRR